MSEEIDRQAGQTQSADVHDHEDQVECDDLRTFPAVAKAEGQHALQQITVRHLGVGGQFGGRCGY